MITFSFTELSFVIRMNTSVTFRHPKQVCQPNLRDLFTPIPNNKTQHFTIRKAPKENLGTKHLNPGRFALESRRSIAAFSFCFRTEMSIPVLQIAKTLFIKRNLLTLPLQRVILVRIKRRWELTDQVTTEPNYWMIKWTGQIRIIYNFNTETVKLRFSKHFSAKNKNLVTQSGTRNVQYPLLPRNNTVYLHWSWVLKGANFFKLNPAL